MVVCSSRPGTPSQPYDDAGRLPLVRYSSIDKCDRAGVGGFGEVFRGKWRGADGSVIDVAVKRSLRACAEPLALHGEVAIAEVLFRHGHSHVVNVLGVCVDAPSNDLQLVLALYDMSLSKALKVCASVDVAMPSCCCRDTRRDRDTVTMLSRCCRNAVAMLSR